MKRISLFLFLCYCVTVLSSCTVNSEMTDQYSETISDESSETSFSSSEPLKQPEPKPKPEDIDETKVSVLDIHDLTEDNPIYNFNVTYQDDNRYYADFEKTDSPAVLWGKNMNGSTESYNAESAVEYARAHWDDGVGLCAPFISRCLLVGGITEYTESSTAISLQLLNSKLGFGQFLPINSDRTVTLPDYAVPGDIVQVYCSYEGMMIHSLIYVGDDSEGHMRVCCHNFRNDGTYAFEVDDPCYDCYSHVSEVFFYHFYNENDPELPVSKTSGAVLYESSGYGLSADYNRTEAVVYARAAHKDGIGERGAENTSRALNAGGIAVSYPNHSAVFFQLLKSRLGSAHSVSVNPNRTVTLPDFAEKGDVAFVYCPEDGIFFSSFIISSPDSDNKMIACSYDSMNTGSKPFRVDSICPGCGADVNEIVLFHFNN